MAAKNRNNSGNSKGGTTTRQRSSNSSRGGTPSKNSTPSRRNSSSSSGSSHSKVGHSNDGYSSNDGYNNDQYNSNDNYSSNESRTGKGGHTVSNSNYGIKPTSSGNNNNRDTNYSNSDDENYGDDNYGSNEDYSSRGRSNNSDNREDNNSYDSRSAKGSIRSNNEPINDPPYDNYDRDDNSDESNYNDNYSDNVNNNDSGSYSKLPSGSQSRSDSRNDTNESHSDSNNERSENAQARGSIDRVWVWAGGAVPRQAINNPRSNWWQNRASLGMTDYVIALNDHDFSRGLGIKPNYIDNRNRSNRWNPICEVLRTINSFNISPHLMVFLPPNPGIIREAAQMLAEIIDRSEVAPRSIQLDLEGWWTRRSQADRRRGEQAIQQYFKDEWRGGNLELGIGVTCIGSTPGAVHGAVEKLDFVIPQIYASPRNYGRPIRENSVRRHFDRAANALNRGGKVIVGQTAYSRYVNPEVMKEMLTILLRINHSTVGGVSEIAYWSDIHLLNSRNNREFFRRMTDLVRGNGLNLNNINRL